MTRPGTHEPLESTTRRAGSLPVGALLQAVRPGQWHKNLLVLVAPAAAGVFDRSTIARSAVAVALFCAAAAAAYLINDVCDRERDRLHPRKQARPIASGALPAPTALLFAVLLAAVAALGATGIQPIAGALIAAYLANSALYSVAVKHQPVYELAAVATGFVLRVAFGAAITSTPVDGLLLCSAGSGALLVVTGKRLSEKRAGHRIRPALIAYTSGFLQQVAAVAATVTLATYTVWAFGATADTTNAWTRLSTIPLMLTLLRYLWHVSNGDAEAPERLAADDHHLAVAGSLWVTLAIIGAIA